jgi:putative ABC transport system permease protein
MKEYMQTAGPVELNGKILRTAPEQLYGNALMVSRNQDYNVNVIIPDSAARGLAPGRDMLHINYKGSADTYEAICKESLGRLKLDDHIQRLLMLKTEALETGNSATTMISYLSVYLGVVFLITAAAVLAIGQLSETSDNIQRYSLLGKLGAGEKMLRRALFSQIFICFGAPMLLALVHAAVGIAVTSRTFSAFGGGGILGGCLFTAAVILVIYGGYFWATYQGSLGILRREHTQQRKWLE